MLLPGIVARALLMTVIALAGLRVSPARATETYVGRSFGLGKLQAGSEWLPDRRLTFEPSESTLSFNFARTIAADETGAVHVVWFEARGGPSQIFSKQSRDGGRSWSGDIVLSRSAHGAQHPAIAVAGPDVYVAWHDFRFRRPDVLLRRSTDRGATWDPEQRLTTDALAGAHPSIAASARGVHVVWGGGSEGSSEVYIRSSPDRAASWGPPMRVSERPYASWVGTVEASGKDVYVAWVDYADANEEEYIRHSADNGATWGPPIRLTRDEADSWAPSLVVSQTALHIVWFDRRDAGISDVAVEWLLNRVMALLGLDPEPPPPRDPNVYYLDPFMRRIQAKIARIQAALPHWVHAGGDVRQFEALFQEFQRAMFTWTTGWEIYYKRSTDGGATWGPDVRLTTAAGLSARPSIAARADGTLHVVWFDSRDGQLEIYYKESADDGVSWEPDVRVTGAPDQSELPSVAVTPHAVHLVWIDRRDGNPELYYKRRDR